MPVIPVIPVLQLIMPIFLKGRGNYTKLCEKCGKPFLKTGRVQKKCEKCKAKGGTRKLDIPHIKVHHLE